jgi:glutathione S-transferase
MKLYYSPGACSLAPHIVAREAGIAIELERVDLASKRCAGGSDFAAISAKAYVPALQLDDGELLTEGPVISQYLADRALDEGLLPPVGTRERYRVLSWLGYLNTEVHKRFSPLFKVDTAESQRERCRTELMACFALLDRQLGERAWLGGTHFSIADAYLFVLGNWARFVRLELDGFPALQGFQRRCAARPRVIEAMRAEGLLPALVGGDGKTTPPEPKSDQTATAC